MSAYPQLPSIDESLIIQPDPKIEVQVETRRMSLRERIQNFTPGFLLQVFALIKFSVVVYIAVNRPWQEKEMPIVIVVLAMNTLLLVSATFQDLCSLVLTWIMSSVALIFYTILFVTVPIFVTSYFASDASRYVKIPQEWKLFRDIVNYKSPEERRFNDGIANGMNVELGLGILVIVTIIQTSLVNGALNAKIEQWKREKQLRELRSSV